MVSSLISFSPLLAKKAAEELRFPKVKGKVCRVVPYSQKFSIIRSKDDPHDEEAKALIFVKGFKRASWTHEDLYNAFRQFGNIVSAKVSQDHTHKSKGFGYVQFESASEAQKAIREVSEYALRNVDGPESPEQRQRQTLRYVVLPQRPESAEWLQIHKPLREIVPRLQLD